MTPLMHKTVMFCKKKNGPLDATKSKRDRIKTKKERISGKDYTPADYTTLAKE